VIPIRVVHASAPIRICDNGGWTDTWVARHGKVFNIAVRPPVNVRIDLFPAGTRDARIVIDAADFGSRYSLTLDAQAWGPHPLLEAAIRRIPPPGGFDVEITVHSEAPAGASTGTSAAVTVALLCALDRASGGARSAAAIAMEAHAVEIDDLGQQSGVQDQWASALGGINFIDIVDYPQAVVTPLHVDEAIVAELNRRLALIYFGRPHRSSSVHEKVVWGLERLGPECRPLASLRAAAEEARDAVLAGDLARLGRSMQANTEAQAELHAELVSADALRIIDIARAHGAAGWKVNGAGGDGGSMTLLGPANDESRRAMMDEILNGAPGLSSIPIAIAPEGLRVW
jgi:D-glycero-alpha-D-manno-heptose-7-phosphate kinase